mmetsp:Transcript_10306/g.29339  ORF Transcript_10306/g.29339 Transcript_10306/m.29339 type:complete len:211 (+) Transcript_10306:652-1284(+)
MWGITLKGRACAKTSGVTTSPFRCLFVPSSNSVMPAAPAPLAAWYVEKIAFLRVNFWCSGHKAIAAIAVVQFGLAMSSLPFMAALFTSGTTRGMLSSQRNALELSMTTVFPSAMIFGENSFEKSPLTAISAKSHCCTASTEKASMSLSPKAVFSCFPADRSEAKRRNSVRGNFLSNKTWTISSPTAPVAPTTPTTSAIVDPSAATREAKR